MKKRSTFAPFLMKPKNKLHPCNEVLLPLNIDQRTDIFAFLSTMPSNWHVQILDYPKSNRIFNQNMHQQMVLLRCPNWNAL